MNPLTMDLLYDHHVAVDLILSEGVSEEVYSTAHSIIEGRATGPLHAVERALRRSLIEEIA